MPTAIVLRSDSLMPVRNLALEELLLDAAHDYPCILLLWRGGPSVVLGKNQNPWRECAVATLRREGIPLSRRISGGGAVYHDEGNLNYALFHPRQHYRETDSYALIIASLRRLGVNAERLGKSSLAVGDRKISGNAFCFRGMSVLHHGTLLVNADLDRMRRYLSPAHLDITTRAIRSVPAEVVNLSKVVPGLTVMDVAGSIEAEFAARYAGAEPSDLAGLLDEARLKDLETKHASWEWCYGYSPGFSATLRHHFTWGRVTLSVNVVHGRIQSATLAGHGLDGRLVGLVEGELLDCPFKSDSMAHRIRGADRMERHAALEELAEWIQNEQF